MLFSFTYTLYIKYNIRLYTLFIQKDKYINRRLTAVCFYSKHCVEVV